MTSVVEIGNLALANLGEDPITSLTDDSKAARLINRRYEPIRDAVLAVHPWNGAMTRASLASVDPAPVWGGLIACALPTDYLRVLRLEDESAKWSVEGRQLVTTASAPVNILYIARVTDPNLFSPGLVEAIAARLAADLAHPITQDNSLIDAMWTIYLQKVKEARSIDSFESSGDNIFATYLVNARKTGVLNPFGVG